MPPKPFEIICYHAQQAAEKALKAYWVFNDLTPQKTHILHNPAIHLDWNWQMKSLN